MSNFLLLPVLKALGNFRLGHYVGYHGGNNFRMIASIGLTGHTYAFTHTHILSSLCIRI